jgi:ABC-type uncharacterized transport system permease subunit
MVEVATVQGRTNANLAAGYGFTGILVAFLARQNPLAVVPVAILLGGISASGGLLQRRLGCPMHRSWFYRGSSSFSCSRAMRFTDGSVF